MPARDVDNIVPPPPELQQRAWQYAREINEPPANIPWRLAAAWMKARNHWPGDLTWDDCRDIFALHKRTRPCR